MIIFNLTIDLALIDAHRSTDNLIREIAKILHVNRDNIVLSSVLRKYQRIQTRYRNRRRH